MDENSFSLPLFAVRCIVSLIWLYEGLWQKIIVRDAHELDIVRQFAGSASNAHTGMLLIGGCETLLALAVLSGLYARPLAWFQLSILLVMNFTGIIGGNGTIANPTALIIQNLPLFACMMAIGLYGPGSLCKGNAKAGAS